MLSFHNDPAIKEKYLARVKAHALADEIIKGGYWKDGKGCAIGCTIHDSSHKKYEIELGIPQIIARLEDRIFENLPNELAKTWPQRFLESIPVGKDLSKIWPKFAIFLLTDFSQCASRHAQCEIIAERYRQQIEGQSINWANVVVDDAAYAAAAAAYAAAYAAASDAAAASAYAAAAAAYAAVYASASASDAAASAYAAAAAAAYAAASASASASDAAASHVVAQSKAYLFQSEKLLELLREA